VVTRSYFVNLRKGRTENPGYEKLRAIAKAMGFRPEAWFDEGLGDGRTDVPRDGGNGIAGRAQRLFDAVRNPKTGEPYTNAEVARTTLGDLSEDVEGLRTGKIPDPATSKVAALAAAFGVEHRFFPSATIVQVVAPLG
jgi:transcriptional regulator with XRE-family HTH domain